MGNAGSEEHVSTGTSGPVTGCNQRLNILIIGDSNVGKTSFYQQIGREQLSKHDLTWTSGYQYLSITTRKHTDIKVQFWDTAGTERFCGIMPSLYRKAHGILLFYDVTSEQSYASVRDRWVPGIMAALHDFRAGPKYRHENADLYASTSGSGDAHRPFRCQVIIVANKSDLVASRVITIERGKLLTNAFDLPYVQISAEKDERATLQLPLVLLVDLILEQEAELRRTTRSIDTLVLTADDDEDATDRVTGTKCC